MSVTWYFKPHTELSKAELYAALALRTQVFVVEQNCPYLEVDGRDLQGDTCHLLGWQGSELVAYLRVLDPALNGGEVVIGRVVTAASARGTGLGHGMLERALQACAQRWPGVAIVLSAQAHLQGYYGRYAFVAFGDEYLEDAIPHIGMRRDG